MIGKRNGQTGHLDRFGSRFGLSWTAILTLVLGLAFNSSAVRSASALLFGSQSIGADIASEYLKAQLRETHIEVASESGGFQLASNGPRSGNPLIAARETPFTLTGRGEPDLVVGAAVALASFSRVCPKPILGRGLQPGDASARHRIVLLSERLWRRRFGADPELIGKTIILNDHAYTVIGVMPANFWFPYRSDPVELWIPERTTPDRELLIT
jgi:hypothetical protein